ncbi:DNA phosphorothioation-dependent restriction protein DptG [Bacillus safensis subsp. safensis]|uniref:DNA phosphorothioation-dependent restriction protein DptG n=1 Tax=Bacillus safensis TaxID=561879 RepID=UPI0032EAA2B7
MKRILNIDEIEKALAEKHSLKDTKKIFPFTTHGAVKAQNNTRLIISELSRSITHLDFNSETQEKYYEKNTNIPYQLSKFIVENSNINFSNDHASKDFIRFIEGFLFNSGTLNISHPYLYNLGGLNTKSPPIIKNLSKFISDVLINRDQNIHNVFTNSSTDNLLMNIVLTNLKKLMKENPQLGIQNYMYQNILPHLTELFREDFSFMMKHKEFFLEHIELITLYYTFMYIIQVSIKLPELSDCTYAETTPLYFALDWEAITKKRYAATIKGYKKIKEDSYKLFAHEYVLQLLSFNIFNENNQKSKDITNYYDLINKISTLGDDSLRQFKIDLKDLIIVYSNKHKLEIPELNGTINDHLVTLLNQVCKGMNNDAQVKYGASIEQLGQKIFLKRRGSLGYVLNVTHDFLMMMTAVIVKENRMPLKTLLEEFRMRGISFDRFTIQEIVNLFSQHNILENKSDSGDAQYVKPIL